MHGLTVVFDLDGTLVETAPDLINATNHCLGIAGHAPVSAAHLRPHISFGARAMVREALRINGVPAVAEAELDRLLPHMLTHYAANIAAESHPYPGLERALGLLLDEGARLAVCTNKEERLSRLLLDALGLSGRFHGLAGRDTFAVCKPDPAHLRGAIRLAGGSADDAIMVGDSATDIRTARAAGIPVIAVPFGYTDVHVRDLGPDRIIEHYDELVAAVMALRPRT